MKMTFNEATSECISVWNNKISPMLNSADLTPDERSRFVNCIQNVINYFNKYGTGATYEERGELYRRSVKVEPGNDSITFRLNTQMYNDYCDKWVDEGFIYTSQGILFASVSIRYEDNHRVYDWGYRWAKDLRTTIEMSSVSYESFYDTYYEENRTIANLSWGKSPQKSIWVRENYAGYKPDVDRYIDGRLQTRKY